MCRAIVPLLVSLFLTTSCGKAAPPPTAETQPAAPPSASDPPPASSSAALEDVPPPAPLGSYVTKFRTDKDGRAWNIDLGARQVDGAEIAPGATWSFNDTVGRRTTERGFRPAATLFDGEILQDVGGGMCQVSSTIFAASLLTGLTVVERYPHSRPSSYVPKGMDATVNYPEVCWVKKKDPRVCFDLRLKNPYDFPLRLTAKVSDVSDEEARLTVELWGKGPVARVETEWATYSTPPFERRWRRMWRKGEWRKRAQEGRNGLTGALIVDITWPDGEKSLRNMFSQYAPVDEVWHVGRDWDTTRVPWED